MPPKRRRSRETFRGGWSPGLAARIPGAALGVGLVFLVGCAGYRLGPTNPEVTAGQSIQVQFFENQTIEPRLPEALNHALRKALQRDGSYALATREEGDIVVRGAITDYTRRPLSYQPTDIISVQDYEIRLTARLTAVNRATGKVLVDRTVTGRTSLRVGSDLPSAERQALPILAEDWAGKAATLLAEGEW